MSFHMLYAYCICEEDNQDDFLENSFIGGHFQAFLLGTASWRRTSEKSTMLLVWQLNMENHFSHPRSRQQPQGLRRAGTQFYLTR